LYVQSRILKLIRERKKQNYNLKVNEIKQEKNQSKSSMIRDGKKTELTQDLYVPVDYAKADDK